jgi:hypothetical protein
VRELNTLFRKNKTLRYWESTTKEKLFSESVEHIPDCIGKLQALEKLVVRCVVQLFTYVLHVFGVIAKQLLDDAALHTFLHVCGLRSHSVVSARACCRSSGTKLAPCQTLSPVRHVAAIAIAQWSRSKLDPLWSVCQILSPI